MKYFDAVANLLPRGAWKLDGDYTDSSGLAQTGSLLSGTLNILLPTSYGSVNSMRVGNGTVVRLPNTSYSQTYGPKPFSIAINFFPISATTETGLVTHDGVLDGITFDSTSLYFTVNSSTTSYRVSTALPTSAAFVVGVFDGNSVQLFVDGESKGILEAPVKILPTFTNGGFLYCGQGTSTAGLDNVVVFDYALNSQQVSNLFVACRNNQDQSMAYGSYGSIYVDMTEPLFVPHVRRNWTGDDWYDASFSGVAVSATGVEYSSAGGTWTSSVMLASLTTTNIVSSKISWTGSNITVQTSFDGTTWTSATNGGVIGGITYPYNVTSKVLFVRVSFSTDGVLSELSVDTYTSFTFVASDTNRAVTYKGTVTDAVQNFIPGQRDDIGAFFNPGSMRISADSSASPLNISGLEFFIKIPVGAPTFTVFQNGSVTSGINYNTAGTVTAVGASSTSFCLNGVSVGINVAANIIPGVWNHLAIAFSAGNHTLFFGTPIADNETRVFRMARPVIYLQTMSTAALQETFNNVFNRQAVTYAPMSLGISQNPVHTQYNIAWTQT